MEKAAEHVASFRAILPIKVAAITFSRLTDSKKAAADLSWSHPKSNRIVNLHTYAETRVELMQIPLRHDSLEDTACGRIDKSVVVLAVRVHVVSQTTSPTCVVVLTGPFLGSPSLGFDLASKTAPAHLWVACVTLS